MSELQPSEWFDIGPCGATTNKDVPQEIWESVLASTLNFTKAVPWIVGDLLNYGEATYGEKYVQAIEMTGLSYSTLAQYCSVAKAFPYDERDPKVPYSYYRRLKSLPTEDRQKFLDAAIEGEYASETDLKESLEDHKRPPDLTNVLCPACQSQLDDNAWKRGKCQECDSKAPEWAVLFNKLLDAGTAMRTTGEVEPWIEFVRRYKTEETE